METPFSHLFRPPLAHSHPVAVPRSGKNEHCPAAILLLLDSTDEKALHFPGANREPETVSFYEARSFTFEMEREFPDPPGTRFPVYPDFRERTVYTLRIAFTVYLRFKSIDHRGLLQLDGPDERIDVAAVRIRHAPEVRQVMLKNAAGAFRDTARRGVKEGLDGAVLI